MERTVTSTSTSGAKNSTVNTKLIKTATRSGRARRLQQQNQPLDNRGQLKQKVSQANADYSRQLREHRANKGNYTPEEYQRIREDIMAEWEEVKGMLQETHGYAQKKQNTGLNSGQIELALSKTPIPGEPQKKKFSNTSYRPQKNIYA